MSASTRVQALAALAALVTACQASSEPTRPAAADSGLFEARPSDWRPLSTTHLFFYHVEQPASGSGSRKTYVETVRSEAFQAMYGNLVLSSGDYRVSGLTGDPQAFRPLVASGFLERIDSTASFAKRMDEARSNLGGGGDFSGGAGEIFLFPDRPTLDRFARFVSSGGVAGLAPFRALSEGCLYSRLTHSGTKNEAAILLAHAPDGELSLSDSADRACLNNFFIENMGVRRDKAHLVLPDLPKGGFGDCSIARIVPPGTTAPKRTGLACPEAPNRRGAVLLHYLNRRAAGDPKAAALADRIPKNCAELVRQGNRQDLSCNEIVRGDS